MLTTESPLTGYVPIHFDFLSGEVVVKWVERGAKPFAEPFFHQSLVRLKKSETKAQEALSGLQVLLHVASQLAPVKPAGLIFHISRCGSTLLANVLATTEGGMVLSEAQPISALLQPDVFDRSPFNLEERDGARRMLMDCMTSIYGHCDIPSQPKLFIKFNSVNTLCMRTARMVWPDVPSLMVIRDPAEVVVSDLLRPGSWIKNRHKLDCFGWSGAEAENMDIEEYCAQVTGHLCQTACEMMDDQCRVIDYSNINDRAIRAIARGWGIELPPAESEKFRTAMDSYSKDPKRERPFKGDRRKRGAITNLVRGLVDRWAQQPYEQLRKSEYNWC